MNAPRLLIRVKLLNNHASMHAVNTDHDDMEWGQKVTDVKRARLHDEKCAEGKECYLNFACTSSLMVVMAVGRPHHASGLFERLFVTTTTTWTRSLRWSHSQMAGSNGIRFL